MQHNHQLSNTTHTVEMAQIAELNGGLRESARSQAIRASLLGLQGVEVPSGSDDDHSPERSEHRGREPRHWQSIAASDAASIAPSGSRRSRTRLGPSRSR